MYNLSTSLFGCNAHALSFFSLISCPTSFNSLSFHCSIPAPCPNTATAHAFIAVILFFPFSFDFRINRSLGLYSSIFFFFHFILFHLIQFNYAQMCILPFRTPSLLHYLVALFLHIKLLFLSSWLEFPIFSFQAHPNVSTKSMNSFHKCIHLFFTLGKQLQIIHK